MIFTHVAPVPLVTSGVRSMGPLLLLPHMETQAGLSGTLSHSSGGELVGLSATTLLATTIATTNRDNFLYISRRKHRDEV